MYIKLCIGNIVLTMSAPVPSPAVLDTMVKIIMSQTDMSHDLVVSELERTNYDLKRVIREYMRGDSNDSASASGSGSGASSANQLRFSEIRNFMDKSSEMYYRKQETTRIYNEVLERKKQMAAAAAAAAEAAATADATVKAKL
jgi:hypothetical protein